MSDPTDFILNTSAGFTHAGVPGNIGEATVAFEATVAVTNVLLIEDTVQIIALEDAGGVILQEGGVLTIPAPVVSCPTDTSGNNVITIAEWNPLMQIRSTVPTGVVAGDSWLLVVTFRPRTLIAATVRFTGTVSVTDIANGYVDWYMDATMVYPDGAFDVTSVFTHGLTQSAAGTLTVTMDVLLGAPTIVFPQDINGDGNISGSEFTNPIVVHLLLPSGTVAGDAWTANAGQYGNQSGYVSSQDATNGYVALLIDVLVPIPAPVIRYTADPSYTGTIDLSSFTNPLILNISLPPTAYAGNILSVHLSDGVSTLFAVDYALTDVDITAGTVAQTYSVAQGISLTTTAQINQASLGGSQASITEFLVSAPALIAPTFIFPQDLNGDAALTGNEFNSTIHANMLLPPHTAAGNTYGTYQWLVPYGTPVPANISDLGVADIQSTGTLTAAQITTGSIPLTQTGTTRGMTWIVAGNVTNAHGISPNGKAALQLRPYVYTSHPYPLAVTEFMHVGTEIADGVFTLNPTVTEFMHLHSNAIDGTYVQTTTWGTQAAPTEFMHLVSSIGNGTYALTTTTGSYACPAEYMHLSTTVGDGSIVHISISYTMLSEYMHISTSVGDGTLA